MYGLLLLSVAALLPKLAQAAPAISKAALLSCARKESIIAPGEKIKCFSMSQEGNGIALREIHGGACGGDPSTSPLRTFFSIRKDPTTRKMMLGYETADSWRPCH